MLGRHRQAHHLRDLNSYGSPVHQLHNTSIGRLRSHRPHPNCRNRLTGQFPRDQRRRRLTAICWTSRVFHRLIRATTDVISTSTTVGRGIRADTIRHTRLGYPARMKLACFPREPVFSYQHCILSESAPCPQGPMPECSSGASLKSYS